MNAYYGVKKCRHSIKSKFLLRGQQTRSETYKFKTKKVQASTSHNTHYGTNQWDGAVVEVNISEVIFHKWLHDVPSSDLARLFLGFYQNKTKPCLQNPPFTSALYCSPPPSDNPKTKVLQGEYTCVSSSSPYVAYFNCERICSADGDGKNLRLYTPTCFLIQ